jgi:hypothetical protein
LVISPIYREELEKFLQGFGWGNLMERDQFEVLEVDGMITLKRILKKYDRTCIEFTLFQNRARGGVLGTE